MRRRRFARLAAEAFALALMLCIAAAIIGLTIFVGIWAGALR